MENKAQYVKYIYGPDYRYVGNRFKIIFSFYGTGVYIGLDYGSLSAAFRWRIDGGEWSEVTHPLPTWVGQTGWFHLAQLAYDLESGKHDVEIESVLFADCEGSRFNLALIGVI